MILSDIKHILIEAFNDTYEYEAIRTRSGDLAFRFEAGDRVIRVDFDEHPRNLKAYEVAFAEIGKGSSTMNFGITGSGDEFRVLGTVMKIIGDFIKEHSPNIISFSAEKDEGSRAQLYHKYHKLLKRYIPVGYSIDVDHKGSDYRSYFAIVKDAE